MKVVKTIDSFWDFFLAYRKQGNDIVVNPLMVKPFRLTYLTFYLLLTYRTTLSLPKYKLKVVNICEMHGAGGLEVVVFD